MELLLIKAWPYPNKPLYSPLYEQFFPQTASIVRLRFSDWGQGWVGSRPSGPITMNFCREWAQELGFDGATVCSGIRDDRAGAKNTGLDGLTIRERKNSHLVWLTRSAPPPPQEPPVGDLLHSIYISLGPSSSYTC